MYLVVLITIASAYEADPQDIDGVNGARLLSGKVVPRASVFRALLAGMRDNQKAIIYYASTRSRKYTYHRIVIFVLK